MALEKESILVWDYAGDSLDELISRVNYMIGKGWRLTHMEKVTNGQEVEISFEKGTPEPPATKIAEGPQSSEPSAVQFRGPAPLASRPTMDCEREIPEEPGEG